ncbi:aminotransferase class IV family protein [Roseovarius sp. EL26]|uniref:aminotransferase class IV family protein n=1 Tax=Roseovarius sp. EL26 TaxID=2126672 RepID=UPI000EA2D280|nr:aminotransferase class IV family protein [Roseovarius sp. EL26]
MENPLCPPSDPNFRLIETFGFAPELGCMRLDLHLERLSKSAAAFGIAFDRDQACDMANAITSEVALRCRMTLDPFGKVDLVTAQMSETPVGKWTLAVAPERLKSDTIWLAYKTTQRTLYDQTRANLPTGVDELIFLNERGEVCEGTITNIFIETAKRALVTPPLTSGLLPGVLRHCEIACGRYAEQIITLDDLNQARQIWVGNSLRGLIPSRMV